MELLFPQKSYILEILDRLRDLILNEKFRASKSSDISPVQLLFSFTLLLSENDYLLQKYCNHIIEIVHKQINTTLKQSSTLVSYSLSTCIKVFSVGSDMCVLFQCRDCYSVLQLSSLNKLITSLVNYVLSSSEGEESTSLEVSLALQCIREYWMIVPDYVNQKGMHLFMIVFMSFYRFRGHSL